MSYHFSKSKVLKVLFLFSKNKIVDDLCFKDLAERSGLSLRTIPRVLDDLEREGLIKIIRMRGRGLKNKYIMRGVKI